MSIPRSLISLARNPLNNNWISCRSLYICVPRGSLFPLGKWGRRGFLAAGGLELPLKTPMAPVLKGDKDEQPDQKIWHSGLTPVLSLRDQQAPAWFPGQVDLILQGNRTHPPASVHDFGCRPDDGVDLYVPEHTGAEIASLANT